MHTLTRRSVLTGTLATSIALALAACSDDGGVTRAPRRPSPRTRRRS